MVTVQLTATAAAVQGDTLYAGTSEQPMLHVTVQGATPTAIDFAVGSDQLQQSVSLPTTDDAGTHYDLALATQLWPEGRYSVQATAEVGDGGVASNMAYLVVDRTPPTLAAWLNATSPVLRDAVLGPTIVADDGQGPGIAAIEVGITGAAIAGPSYALFAMPLAIRGASAAAVGTLPLSRVPYDAWSTDKDGVSFRVQVTATDLLGNSASQSQSISVTRLAWRSDAGPGAVSLGARGEVLLNSGSAFSWLSPADGSVLHTATLEDVFVSTPLPTATLIQPGVPPLYVVDQVQGEGANSELYAFSGTQPFWQQPLPDAMLSTLAIDVARGRIVAVDQTCQGYYVDGETAQLQTLPFPYPLYSCNWAVPALGNVQGQSVLYEAMSYGVMAFDYPGWSFRDYFGQEAAPTAIAAEAFYSATAGAPPFSLIKDSTGASYVLASDYKLSRVGPQSWSVQLAAGKAPSGGGGVVAGAGGLVYAVDGAGVLTALDADGNTHWSSPLQLAAGIPMIDRCTGHAALSGANGSPLQVVLDSQGVDASAASWPMAGHDVFQTYDAANTTDVDCGDHI